MKRIFFLIGILMSILSAMAQGPSRVPARMDPRPVVQPDGDTIMLILRGDEAWHCHYTLDGRMVKQGRNGWWYFARESKCRTYTDMRGHKRHRIVRTCRRVHSKDIETQAQQAPPRGLREHAADSLHYQYVEAYNREVVARAARAPRRIGQPITPAPRVLVIMTNFSDYQFVRTKAEVDSVFSGVLPLFPGQPETGSVRKYFFDQSQGLYNPQFDIVGPVTLSKSYAYYGQNYNGNNTRYAGEMVAEACALVNDRVNFADYDANGDGDVDLVFIYFAGFGENDPPSDDYGINANNLAWPHYYTLDAAGTSGLSRHFDGKRVNAYECANELDGWYSTPSQPVPSGIGVLVHEYCHGLGLPDMYKTNNATHKTLGQWSIMDYGPYNNDMRTPPSLTAYERSFLGWMQPTLLNHAANSTLTPLSEGNLAGYITTNGAALTSIANPGTEPFYMVENRQQTGWDIGLPGEGLLLYKVQYNGSNWSNNTVNNDARAMGVDILEADGLAPTYNKDGYQGKQGDCYPTGSSNSISVVSAYPLTEITQQTDGTITFKVCGGETATLMPQLQDSKTAHVISHNGQLLIEHQGRYYTLLGNETNL